MALDWLEIVQFVEGVYPEAVGGTTRDETLRLQLVPWVNQTMIELVEVERFSGDFETLTITTATGTQAYPIPSSNTTTSWPSDVMSIKQIYYINQSGTPIRIERVERYDGAYFYGDKQGGSTAVVNGVPRFWSMNNRTIELFPAPDAGSADASGTAYTLYVECHHTLFPIIETTATTVAGNPAVTVSNTNAFTSTTQSSAAVQAGTPMTIRGAGYQNIGGNNGNFSAPVLSITPTTTVTLTANVPSNASAVQGFFNAIGAFPATGQIFNWAIYYWPKLLTFGVLRHVADYLMKVDDQQKWEAKYQDQVNKLREFEFDRQRTFQHVASAHTGQKDPTLYRIDQGWPGFDVRG